MRNGATKRAVLKLLRRPDLSEKYRGNIIKYRVEPLKTQEDPDK
jgi:hypothetical protein